MIKRHNSIRSTAGRHPQRGAVIVTAAFVLLFLLGFMAIALDFGHLFIVRSELQTAVDSCALAAAQELDGTSTALERATNAGITAGNLNRVNFQSPTWSNQGQITSTDISFKDADYLTTAQPRQARYAQCRHTQPGIAMWLLQAMGAFTGNTATYSNRQQVAALAVATRASAQHICSIPVAYKPKTGGAAPNYGLLVGEWVSLPGNGHANAGEMGWYNLDGSTGAKETYRELIEDYCGARLGDIIAAAPTESALDVPYNQRFGIYKQGDPGPSVHHPDLSGYAYTAANWKNPVPQNAWAGDPAPGSDPTAANFQVKRAAFASFDDKGINVRAGSQIAFGDRNALNGYKTLATPGMGGQHYRYGYNRRLVTIPVIDEANRITDFLCVFMLHPLTGPNANGHLEFLGNAADPTGPCVASGLAGGLRGPLVTVLVQ